MSRLALDARVVEEVAELLQAAPETNGLGLIVQTAAAPLASVVRDVRDNDVITLVYASDYTIEPVSRDGDRHEISVGVTLIRRAVNTFAEAKAMMVVAANVRAALTRKHLALGPDILAEWQATTSDKSIEHAALRETQAVALIHILARYSVHTSDHDQE
ncbi:MAG: hypothetical protein F2534_03530 [Actinobacteria bacterium]|nr:hypothetical protein [Actinomycetota bacterium]